MNTNELRIGNVFIEKYSKKIISVIGLKENVITFSGAFLGKWQAEPIPLTEKWLKKCDFNFKELGFKDLSVSYGTTSKEIHFVIGNYYKKLNYVHEFQNIYFALTKEELKIN